MEFVSIRTPRLVLYDNTLSFGEPLSLAGFKALVVLC